MHYIKRLICKIEGCNEPVFNTTRIGLCSLHYGRYMRCRMASDGSLKKETKKIYCQECGEFIKESNYEVKDNNLKYCDKCKPLAIKACNRRGYLKYYYGNSGKKRLMIKYLNQIIRYLENCKKHKPFLELRKQGKTFKEIGTIMGVTGTRAEQIIKKYNINNKLPNPDKPEPKRF